MKLTEVKYTKRFNLGNYEHEEITVGAAPEMGETVDQVLTILKESVEGMPREVVKTPPTTSGKVTINYPPSTQTPQVNHAPQNLGSYVIPIGKKHKGKRLDEMDMYELDGFCQWLYSQPKKPQGATKEFLEKAEAYLKQKERPQQGR